MEYKGKFEKRIGHYILVEEIGKDDIFTQYIVVDTVDEKLYIGKIIPLQYLDDKTIRINSQREIDTLSKIKLNPNNNIISIKSVKNSSKNNYIITEYCNGGNLKDFLKFYINKNKTPFNEKFIQNVITQIASGLEYLHNNNIIHRFIKLENIFINIDKYKNKLENGNILPKINYSEINLDEPITFKIGNFYHSKILQKKSHIRADSDFFIEPKYMSPEMVGNVMNNSPNKNIYDGKNFDIWSLGIITYELLTGEKPFEGNNIEDVYNNILKRKYYIPDNLKASKEIISFINGLFQYNPNKIYDWSQIKEHPFLKNNAQNFNYDEKYNLDSGETLPSKVYILPNNDSIIEPKVEPEVKLKIIDNEINNLKQNIINLIKAKENAIQKFEKDLNELNK